MLDALRQRNEVDAFRNRDIDDTDELHRYCLICHELAATLIKTSSQGSGGFVPKRFIGLVASSDAVTVVEGQIPDVPEDPITIVGDTTWKLQKGDRASAYAVLHQRCVDHVRENKIERRTAGQRPARASDKRRSPWCRACRSSVGLQEYQGSVRRLDQPQLWRPQDGRIPGR